MIQSTLTRLPKFALFLLIALLCACQTPPPPAPVVERPKAPPPAPAPDNSAELARNAAFQDLVAMQDRLYRVAAPLLLNNLNLCQRRAYLLGFTAKNKYSYSNEFVDSAAKMLGLGDQLQIMGVMPGSGAASVGLKNGDKLVAIGEVQLPQGPSAEMQARGVLASLLSEKTSIGMTVNRNGQDMSLQVPLTHVCAFSMEVGNTDTIDAYDDGHRVLLTRGMMKAFQSDDELAMIIAGEMARNALDHPTKLHSATAMSETIDNLSRVHPDLDKLPKAKPPGDDYDLAADKRALYMLARAVYPFEDYAKFWARIAQQGGPADAYTAQHPLTPRRTAAMTRVIAEIKAKQAAHKTIQP